MTHEQRQTLAVQAAISIAARYGIVDCTPTILRDSHHTSVHLAPFPIVARVATTPETATGLANEVTVVRYLLQAGAPVVAPSAALPPGPHVHDAATLTYWTFVEHRTGHEVAPAAAAAALQALHEAFEGYTGNLPLFTDAIAQCHSWLEDPRRLSALAADDRRFLLIQHRRLTHRLASIEMSLVPLHGEPHLGNLLASANGPLWIDFEAVCTGPREWDVTCLPEQAATSLRGVDPELLSVLRALRSLCVAVWCWDKPDRAPEVREAAAYHLARLHALAGTEFADW